MRARNLIVLALPVAVIAGCIPMSLHPIYTEKSLVTDDGILGFWGEGEDFWRFEEGQDKSYKLTISERAHEAEFEAHLTQITDRVFLDMLLTDFPSSENEWIAMHVIPAHTFWEFQRDGDTLRMRTLNYDWLKERFEKNRFWVAHEPVQDWHVFTAKPERMQRFIRKWMRRDEAWNDWEDMPRMTAPPEPAAS